MQQIKSHRIRVMSLLAMAMFSFGNLQAIEGYEDLEVNFNFGEDCAKLAALTRPWPKELSHIEDTDLRQRFCSTTTPDECEAYTWIVEDFGVLSKSPYEGFCLFIPFPLIPDTDSGVHKNYGLQVIQSLNVEKL